MPLPSACRQNPAPYSLYLGRYPDTVPLDYQPQLPVIMRRQRITGWKVALVGPLLRCFGQQKAAQRLVAGTPPPHTWCHMSLTPCTANRPSRTCCTHSLAHHPLLPRCTH